MTTTMPAAEIAFVLGVILLLTVGQIVSLLQLHRTRQRCEDLEKWLKKNTSDLAAFEKAAMGAGERLMRMEQQVRRLVERQDQVEMYSSNSRPYSQAIQLVQRGASVEELISTCGLTRGEAELICVLHGTREAHVKSGQDPAQH